MTEEHDGGDPPENLTTVTEEEDQPLTELPNLDMQQQDAEGDGPQPGLDNNNHQLKEETEQALEPAAVSAVISDMKMEDVRQDAQNEEGPQPGSEARPSSVLELVSSDITVDRQDSEDEGPPPGRDSKSQSEPKLQVELPSTHPSGHMEAYDVQKDAQNEDDLPPQLQTRASQLSEPVSSDLDMQEQGAEDDGPPAGCDYDNHQRKEVTEQALELAAVSAVSSDMKMENIRQDVQNEEGPQPGSEAHPSSVPELVSSELICESTDHDSEDVGPPPGWDPKSQPEPKLQVERHTEAEDVQDDAQNDDHLLPQLQALTSQLYELVAPDMQVEQHDSEDEGPPPGWDSKCQPEPESQLTRPTTSQPDAQNEEGPEPRPQEHPSPPPEVAPSDIKVDQQDSEDEGPPPGWDSKPQIGSNPTTPCSDTKTEDIQQIQNEDDRQPQLLADPAAAPEPEPEPVPSDTQVEQQDSEDDGPPPGWDFKGESEPKGQEACPSNPQSDTKTGDVQLSVQNEDGPEPQRLSRSIPAPELVKSEEQDSEDEGPPPGWDSKCQPERKSQMACSSDSKLDDDQRDTHDDEGPPPGWESAPQQESQAHLSLPSTVAQSGGQNNCKAVKEIPRPPSRQRSITPTEPQVVMSKRRRSIERPITPVEPQMPMPKRKRSFDNHEMGQMVCGSCRLLLSYPRGARYVECACCLEENYVLEEHEVGQVVCVSCDVLLMYPYGAPKVKCANCKVETEIGDQNRRPPLSEHKKRARQHLRRVQAG